MLLFVVKTGALLLARNGVTVRPLDEPALKMKTYLVSRADKRIEVGQRVCSDVYAQTFAAEERTCNP